MRAPLLMVAALLVGAESALAGEPVQIDAVAAYGVEPDDAQAMVAEAARAARLDLVVGPAHGAGARLVIRVTIAEVAGELLASVDTVDRRGRTQRLAVSGATPEALVRELARLLASTATPPSSGRARSGWIAAGVAGALAVSGSIATWHAYNLRDAFFARHVDASGDVFGISLDDARREEARARGWSAAGLVMLAGAAASGITATVLLVRSPEGDVRPAGVTVGGRF